MDIFPPSIFKFLLPFGFYFSCFDFPGEISSFWVELNRNKEGEKPSTIPRSLGTPIFRVQLSPRTGSRGRDIFLDFGREGGNGRWIVAVCLFLGGYLMGKKAGSNLFLLHLC
jgi:hypothetical protein